MNRLLYLVCYLIMQQMVMGMDNTPNLLKPVSMSREDVSDCPCCKANNLENKVARSMTIDEAFDYVDSVFLSCCIYFIGGCIQHQKKCLYGRTMDIVLEPKDYHLKKK